MALALVLGKREWRGGGGEEGIFIKKKKMYSKI